MTKKMTVKEINEKLKSKLMNVRETEDVYSYLDSSLKGTFLNLVKQLDADEKDRIISEAKGKTWDDLIKYIEKSIQTILNCYHTYMDGKIGESIQLMVDFLENNNGPLRVAKIGPGKVSYRVRKKEKEGQHPFQAKDMFHVPFNKRHLLHSYRYSVLGYPCLYLSNSILGCWEEMDEPAIKDMFISCLKADKEIEVLDLALPYDGKKEYDVLCSWPLVFACSLKVKYPQSPFKPEYVIPQLVMQALVQTTKFDGCLYTSTHRNESFDVSEKLLHNLAIPVKKQDENGIYCTELSSIFKVTNAICYEYELIKGKIKIGDEFVWEDVPSDNKPTDTNEGYYNSVYGQMEDILKKMKFHTITK